MKEREISLIDLIVDILLHWRSLIVWMLIGGLLLGGYGYIQSSRTVAQQKVALENKEDQETVMSKLEKTLSSTEKNDVRTVLAYENFSKYYNQSMLMKLDASNVSKAELTFLITAPDSETRYSIERIYADAISVGLDQWLDENYQGDMDTNGIHELISVRADVHSQSEASGLDDVVLINALERKADSFRVKMIHESEEACRELAGVVIEYVEAQHMKLEGVLGTHDIVLIKEAYNQGADVELLNQQSALLTRITDDNAAATKLRDAFSDDQHRYYRMLVNEDAEAGEVSVEISDIQLKPTVSVKYIAVGMILFAFICVFYLFLKYILNNRIRVTDDLGAIYGVPNLGQIKGKASSRKLFAFVDGLFLQIRDRNKRIFSREEAIGLAGVAVKMAARKGDLSIVYCIGCNLQQDAYDVAGVIENMLKEEKIELTILNNILYDQEAMEKLLQAEGAFLLEKAGETLYDEMAKELELLQRQGIKMLGVVMME